MAQDASKYLGQPVIVEKLAGRRRHAGAGPTWPRPLPDGYTISLYTLAMLRMPYMHKTHWDPINDFTFLIGLSGYTFGFTVRADSPYRTFNDYIEAERGPRQHRLRSTGAGSSPHLLMEEVARNAGVQLNHVPFKGNADMQQALVGGHVMAQSDATGWDQFVDAGKMRLLVTFGEQRTTRWPDVPTAQELGCCRRLALRPCRPQGHGPGRGADPARRFQARAVRPGQPGGDAAVEPAARLSRDSQDYAARRSRRWA